MFYVEGGEWEFRLILEERAEFEVILCVQSTLNGDVVLEEFEELLLECVDFFCDEERIDEREVCVREVLIVPDFLCNE